MYTIKRLLQAFVAASSKKKMRLRLQYL